MSLKDIIIRNNFKFQKRFGQNFITDTNLLASIVQKAELGDVKAVVEIGVGGATLTRAIAEKVDKVYGYEIDRNLKGVIAESLSGVENAEIIFKDFMTESMSALEKMVGGDYAVVANLPYYITTPIIMKLIEQSKNCKKIVVMVQEEVALRLCAKENTSDYGSITVAIDAVANSSIVARVPRTMFFPQPNVDSAVVRIDIDKDKYAIQSREALRAVIRMAFSSRRKTLCNNIINTFKLSRSDAEEILAECGIDKNARGETLPTKTFVELSHIIHGKGLA